MTKKLLLEKLSILHEQSKGFELYFLLKNNHIRRVNLETSLADSLQEKFVDKVTSTFNDSVHFTLKSVDDMGDEKLESEYFYFDNTNMFDSLKFIMDFASEESFDAYSFDEEKFNNVKAILIKIGKDDENIILYKHNYPISVVSKKRTINIFKDGDTFKEVHDDIMKIDINFDFLLIGEHLIVNKLNTLENQMKYTEAISTKALKNLEMIKALDFIENLDKIQDSIKINRLAKKLNKIQKSPVIKIIRDERERVVEFIKTHPQLKKIDISDDGKLKLDTKVSVERFLKLLDDDYLYSQLTNMLYDTKSKASLPKEEE